MNRYDEREPPTTERHEDEPPKRRPRRVHGLDNQPVDPLGEGWDVYHDYKVEDSWLRPVGSPLVSYRPLYTPQLVTAIGRLYGADDDSVLDFARRWGHLGWSRVNGDGESDLHPGDPLWWIRSHARGIALCLDVIYLDRQRDWASLPKVLDKYSSGTPAAIAYGTGEGATELCLQDLTSPRVVAHKVLTTIITENLRGIDPVLDSVERVVGAPTFSLSCRAESPIQAAYWPLAQLALGNLELARCEECGDYFVRTDARESFCPPSKRGVEALLLFAKGRRLTSRCAQRVRARRAYQRARTLGMVDSDAAHFPRPPRGPEEYRD